MPERKGVDSPTLLRQRISFPEVRPGQRSSSGQRQVEVYDDVMDISETCEDEVFRDMQWLAHRALIKDRPTTLELRKLLRESGVDKDFLNACLWMATTYDRPDHIQLYVSMGADVGVQMGGVFGLKPKEVVNYDSYTEKVPTLLRRAVFHQRTDTVRTLLAAGAAITEEASSYVYLMRSCVQRRDMEMLKLLMSSADMFACCPISMLDPYRYTVLGQAVFQDDVEVIQYLLEESENRRLKQLQDDEHGYDDQSLDDMAAYRAKQEATALANAVIFGYHRSAKVLLESPTHAHCPEDTLKQRLLCSSVQSKQRKVISVLLHYHPELITTSVCKHGPSPLHCAAWHNSRAAARLLISAGASRTSKNANGLVPHVLAQQRGHHKTAEIIQNTPVSLKELCLASVRQSLTILPLSKSVEQLNIPKSVKKDLLFE